MNNDNEQLSADLSLHLAQDEPVRGRCMDDAVIRCIGADICGIDIVLGKRVLAVHIENQKIILLTKAVTYLGNPHPLFKKRVQLPTWYKEFANDLAAHELNYSICLLGVYHYQGNIVFVHFEESEYLEREMHNSSAHVYVNDLYQAMRYGIFHKIDANGNNVATIRSNRIRDYLLGNEQTDINIFELFRRFNNGFTFGEWLYALDAIREMHAGEWSKWQETEWAGWFLEYRYNKFTIDNNVTNKMRYISQKRDGEWDFDIRFEEDDFYGDLKASDVTKHEAPGNDKQNLTECICQHDKFWYVIYEHETIKDISQNGIASAERVRYIRSVDSSFDKPETSYISRMKHSVRFTNMYIIELNRINFREVLCDFNQGRQPDGKARKIKFMINKRNIENFVVFRYSYRTNE